MPAAGRAALRLDRTDQPWHHPGVASPPIPPAADGTITRAVLADALREALPELRRRDARDLVDLILDVVIEALEDGEDVLVTGFGHWAVREKAERLGRNPATGEPVAIAERRVVVFKPSAALRAALNPDRERPGT